MLAKTRPPSRIPKAKNSTSFATNWVVNTVCMLRFSNHRYSVTNCAASSSSAINAPTTATVTSVAGKGGVGKTTVAVNLAYTFAARGFNVGIVDTDIHGPNVALMTGVEGLPAEVWVDSSNALLRLKASIKVDDGKDPAQADIDLTFSNFGTPVTITPPAASETFDATQFLESAADGIKNSVSKSLKTS